MSQEQTQARLYGARVSRPGGGDTILVEQTSRLNIPNSSNPYTIDQNQVGRNIARFVNYDDDQQVAEAIRDALSGSLSASEKLGASA